MNDPNPNFIIKKRLGSHMSNAYINMIQGL